MVMVEMMGLITQVMLSGKDNIMDMVLTLVILVELQLQHHQEVRQVLILQTMLMFNYNVLHICGL